MNLYYNFQKLGNLIPQLLETIHSDKIKNKCLYDFNESYRHLFLKQVSPCDVGRIDNPCYTRKKKAPLQHSVERGHPKNRFKYLYVKMVFDLITYNPIVLKIFICLQCHRRGKRQLWFSKKKLRKRAGCPLFLRHVLNEPRVSGQLANYIQAD